MPGGDRTGPIGAGPTSGRMAGFCAGYGGPGYANPAGGRMGRGHRRGGGRGRGRGFGFGPGPFGQAPMYGAYPAYGSAASTREQELESLKHQAAHFQGALEDIQRRIDELATEAPSE